MKLKKNYKNKIGKKTTIQNMFILIACYVLLFCGLHGVVNVCFCTDRFVIVHLNLICLYWLNFCLNVAKFCLIFICLQLVYSAKSPWIIINLLPLYPYYFLGNRSSINFNKIKRSKLKELWTFVHILSGLVGEIKCILFFSFSSKRCWESVRFSIA